MQHITTAVVNNYHLDLYNKIALFNGGTREVPRGLNSFYHKELIKI